MSKYVKKDSEYWSKNHRNSDKGFIERYCNCCSKWKEENYDNFYYKNKSKPELGYQAECKNCSTERSSKRQSKKREEINKYKSDWYFKNKDKIAEIRKEYRAEHLEELKAMQAEWRKNNSEKVNEYSRFRQLHKYHKIKKSELDELYKYTNHSCMYCGISEEDHIKQYGQKLHKDHAYNEGSNGIENCILACRSCNCEKNIKDWDVWYNENNPKYSEEKYNKIIVWLSLFDDSLVI